MNYSFVSLLAGALEAGVCGGTGKQSRGRGCSGLFGVVSGVCGVGFYCVVCVRNVGWVDGWVGLYGRMEGLCRGRVG